MSVLYTSGNSILKNEVPKAVVKVKLEDALKLNDLKLLKQKLLEMQQTIALLELDNKILREEKEILYREFIETIKKYQKQNEGYTELKLMLSGVTSKSDVRKSDGKNEKYLSVMNDVSKNGRELGLETMKFCEFVRGFIKDLPVGKMGKADLEMRAEALNKLSSKFIAFNNFEKTQSGMGRCRIVALKKELGCVILSVGLVHGAFNGLVYRVIGTDVELVIVTVRPYLSAALVTKGNIKEVASMMEASCEQSTIKK